MPRPIYQAIASLDGYVEDEEGNFDWAAPDTEVHAGASPDLLRISRSVLCGRLRLVAPVRDGRDARVGRIALVWARERMIFGSVGAVKTRSVTPIPRAPSSSRS